MTIYRYAFESQREINLNSQILKNTLISVKREIALHSFHLTSVSEE